MIFLLCDRWHIACWYSEARMRHLTSFARFTGTAALALALSSACGGKSLNPGDGDDDGGTSAGGTTNTAGTNTAGRPVGGTSSVGGTGVGGTDPGVAGTGVAGTGVGGNGPYNPACAAPPDAGPCFASQAAWYHDANTGVCRPFTYGGCEGNLNRYPSLGACLMSCRGVSPDYDACTQPSDCILDGTGCCGVCDSPNLSKHDFLAYNKKYQAAFQCSGIPLGLPAPGGNGGADVPACAPCPDIASGSRKFFVPDCVQNQCAVVDLREAEFTACMSDSDCTYRFGTGCCQSCNPADAIAVRKDAKLEPLLCANTGPIACAACPAPTPRDLPVSLCRGDNRCELAYIAF